MGTTADAMEGLLASAFLDRVAKLVVTARQDLTEVVTTVTDPHPMLLMRLGTNGSLVGTRMIHEGLLQWVVFEPDGSATPTRGVQQMAETLLARHTVLTASE